MGLGAATAAQRALERAGWRSADLDLIELNEAFAAQALAVVGVMDWDLARVNVNGGAIALGHPIGASGCRVVVTLLHEMQRRGVRRGLRDTLHRWWAGRRHLRRALSDCSKQRRDRARKLSKVRLRADENAA